jgi:hypothetical protein
MKNNIAQSLIGLACSAVLVIGSASAIDARAAIAQKDGETIGGDYIYSIRAADKLIGIESADGIGVACGGKIIAGNKLAIDDEITIIDRVGGVPQSVDGGIVALA